MICSQTPYLLQKKKIQSRNTLCMIDVNLIQLLACPACGSSVSEISEHIKCNACDKKYPIVDGIPVMLLPVEQLA